jgi:hypothetical protein
MVSNVKKLPTILGRHSCLLIVQVVQEQGLLFDCLIELCSFELIVTIYELRRLTSRKALITDGVTSNTAVHKLLILVDSNCFMCDL